ncbi:hypothetical protein GCM10023203_46570 [Actinomycetospora straminea]|uniref:Uncharacterized protein n=1 Tax=Actinomycetospora straminea TaxID=663607 RepID=A0ABP9EY87_9PSEU
MPTRSVSAAARAAGLGAGTGRGRVGVLCGQGRAIAVRRSFEVVRVQAGARRGAAPALAAGQAGELRGVAGIDTGDDARGGREVPRLRYRFGNGGSPSSPIIIPGSPGWRG